MTRKKKGWENEPFRHGLASKGVRTTAGRQTVYRQSMTDILTEERAGEIDYIVRNVMNIQGHLFEIRQYKREYEISEDEAFLSNIRAVVWDIRNNLRSLENQDVISMENYKHMNNILEEISKSTRERDWDRYKSSLNDFEEIYQMEAPSWVKEWYEEK